MQMQRYELKANPSFTVFEFDSIGAKGQVAKIIELTAISRNRVYNLAFGDRDDNGNFSDFIVTNNGDAEKVLATVAAAVIAFTNRNPRSWVYAQGSTAARSRMYQMGLAKNYAMVSEEFNIFGSKEDASALAHERSWEPFQKGVNYTAFLATRK